LCDTVLKWRVIKVKVSIVGRRSYSVRKACPDEPEYKILNTDSSRKDPNGV